MTRTHHPARPAHRLRRTRRAAGLRLRPARVAAVLAALATAAVLAPGNFMTTTAAFSDSEAGAWALTAGQAAPDVPDDVTGLVAAADGHYGKKADGGGRWLYVGNTDDHGETYRTLIRFELPEAPAGTEIESATLALRVGYSGGDTDDDEDPQTMVANLASPTPVWTESSLPSRISGLGYVSGLQSNSQTIKTNTTYTFTVTELVQAWYDGSQVNNGFVVRGIGPLPDGDSEFYWGFHSRTSSSSNYQPKLDISFRR